MIWIPTWLAWVSIPFILAIPVGIGWVWAKIEKSMRS